MMFHLIYMLNQLLSFQNFTFRFLYNGLKMATHVKNNLHLKIIADDGESLFTFRLTSQEAACALYRSITEYHAFYRCETVRNAVTDQFTRDLKETLISFFGDEESEKKYIFDVQRTSKEVYDHCRRVLYKRGCDPIQNPPAKRQVEFRPQTGDAEVAQLQEQLTKMEDSLKCKICMDAQIDTVFCPCGHMVSCNVCAANIELCPICRAQIQNAQHVFFPVTVSWKWGEDTWTECWYYLTLSVISKNLEPTSTWHKGTTICLRRPW